MIKIEKFKVTGFEDAIRGMRNPMNSWDKIDSKYIVEDLFSIGSNDHKLMQQLIKAGPVEAKFRRMIICYIDIIAPLYWWKEFDTYKVGTVSNSCSTMHKIHEKEFKMEDFSTDKLIFSYDLYKYMVNPYNTLRDTIEILNYYRNLYNKTNKNEYWYQMIQLLPSSYNQKRTIMLNYEVLANIYKNRKTHKLDEWVNFCKYCKENFDHSWIFTEEFEEEE